jgi:hypothetical protein
MDAFELLVWVLRLAFLGLLYLFLAFVARSLWRDLRAAAARGERALGRLIVIASPTGDPAAGTVLPLGAVNDLGRDVNNSIVVEDPFASAQHARLTFRGRTWYVEDLGSTNGTFVNGDPVAAPLPLGYGDEIQVGQVRFRLDRAP